MVCVWKPVMVLGFPACPTVSTACPTRTLTGSGLRSESTCADVACGQYRKHTLFVLGSVEARDSRFLQSAQIKTKESSPLLHPGVQQRN